MGWLQFERLCAEVLELESGIPSSEWRGRADQGRSVLVEHGVRLPDAVVPGRVLVLAIWAAPRENLERRYRQALGAARRAWAGERKGEPPAVVVTNRLARETAGTGSAAVVGAESLAAIVDARPELRLRMPSLLGVRDLDVLVQGEALQRSTGDVDAARLLARVFVPTRTYARALDVLRRHGFTVLTGPPEMGKTAIARMIGLAALTDGWEFHECIRPDELWATFARDRHQVFVADDAFGSTEYRPEAAERWALELDRVLRAMDDRHWLIWTSRPAPLKAGLRLIHREHGVERFPQPAEVHVAADDLDVEEKALILLRHAKAAKLPPRAIGLVHAHGWDIVEHPHFTPERIRRFVGDRLQHVAAHALSVGEAVRTEIREPTQAMAESFRALGDEHRALLIALLDTGPGVVDEHELGRAARRHVDALPRHPHELIDRLTDHFVRVVPPDGVTWVHPSWRDLVIEELAADAAARRRFLERCSLEGLLLALSVSGGVAGEREFPLLAEDADWDAVADRTIRLLPELDDSGVLRLLAAVAAARDEAERPHHHAELDALTVLILEAAARAWHGPVTVSLLEAWFGLAARLPKSPAAPDVAPTWIEILPTAPVDRQSIAELDRLDDWLRLVETLAEHAPDTLARFGFPQRQAAVIDAFIAARDRVAPETALLVSSALRRIVRLIPSRANDVLAAAGRLAPQGTVELAPAAAMPTPAPPERTLVTRILRDLRPEVGS